MNVLIISTSDINGGAAIAAFRLMKALHARGVGVKMLVRDKRSDSELVTRSGCKLMNDFRFYRERGEIFLHNCLSRNYLFDISIASTGVSVVTLPQFTQADIIHLHWINQAMLSTCEIGKIIASGKKVVWTMHDMWPVTGICHHAGTCTRFHHSCGDCPYLKRPSKNDLSRKIYKEKRAAYSLDRISFVACSRWLEEQAKRSSLTTDHNLVSIPNPIDTDQYSPGDKMVAKRNLGLPTDKKIVLFAAVKASDKRKGVDYLIEAARLLKDKGVLFLIAGSNGGEIAEQLPGVCLDAGFISPDRMPEYYNAADVFVTPSLQENLPNTLMEAMACGTPCVGFNTGGIPEMIDHHRSGYVAKYKDAGDLANGLHWTLFEADQQLLSENAREKVLSEYAEEKVVNRYLRVYAE
ncbi:glycosyltransferase family 4 protein [Petrimonas mucosa]|jgi:glycosyltransferase involved in cell wall biosynthesis|uniref:glycosyltransferase family 4 protein n=1 Tax=Petrimonas mucosa TaxID=1642646 RepID=UPI003BC40DB2